jgi:hypothetical protein
VILKKYTLYHCPTSGHCSIWTGAMMAGQRDSDGICAMCGAEMVEVVEDGHTYRLEWETIGPFSVSTRPGRRQCVRFCGRSNH